MSDSDDDMPDRITQEREQRIRRPTVASHGRFKDWSSKEIVLLLTRKGVVIRGEHLLPHHTLRDLMKAYYDGKADPKRPVDPYNSVTAPIVDRGIVQYQHLFFRYIFKMRLYSNDVQQDELLVQNEEEYGDAYGGEIDHEYILNK